MDALKKSIANEAIPKGKWQRKASAGQKEMLLPIDGKRGAEKKKAFWVAWTATAQAA